MTPQPAAWAPSGYPIPAPAPVPMTAATPVPPQQPPPRQPASPSQRRRRKAFIIAGIAFAVVVVLVVALFAWAPWVKPSPKIPGNLRASSPTASSVQVQWDASVGSPKPDRYLLQRDGKQIAIVPAAQTSYVDKGLTPGVQYKYSVASETGSRHSAQSAEIKATTTTPSPIAPTAGKATISSLTFSWTPPADAPTPTKYVVMRNGATVKEVPGTTTSFEDTGLTFGTAYRYQVSAAWGDAVSDPSPELEMTTATPSATQARLAGDFDVSIKVTASGGNVGSGQSWTDSWTFNPKCASGPCAVIAYGDVSPSGFTSHTFKIGLNREPGGVYAGAGRAHITHCGPEGQRVSITDVVNVRLTVKTGFMDGSTWAVDTFTGSMRIDSPYTTVGSYFCPAQSMNTTISGS